MTGGVSGWYKLLPELEGQAYNIPCVVEDKIQALEDEMQVAISCLLFISLFLYYHLFTYYNCDFVYFQF